MILFPKPFRLFPTVFFLFLIFSLPDYSRSQNFGSIPCLNKKLSIIAYIVRDSLGDPGITQQQVFEAIDSANKDFAPICLSFIVCDFVYVDNFQYDNYHIAPNPDTLDDEKEMLTLYYRPAIINMYFVKDITTSPECGHAYMPGSPWDLVVIKKECLPTKTISHELGHFFGLYHTFENPGELVDGSNCTSSGDQLCDTPADPKGTVDASCKFTGPVFKDANGDWYFPPVDNIMSYYDNCPCRFTREQYLRMVEQYLLFRSYLC